MDRHVRSDDDIAHHGMDAVGPDDGVGLSSRAIGKSKLDARRALLQPNQLLIEMNDLRGNRAAQRIV